MYTFDDLLLFVKIIDMGSFAATSQSLKITQSTVSRRIKLLEAELGIKLFQYEGKKAVPTNDGKLIYNKVNQNKKTFESINTYIDTITQNKDSPQGELYVILPTGPTFVFIIPYIMLFKKKYSEVILNIIYKDSSLDFDLVRDDLDFAIINHAPDKPHQSTYKITNLITPKVGLFCTQEYINRYGRPIVPDDLDNHSLLGYVKTDKVKTSVLELLNKNTGEKILKDVRCGIYMNSSINHLQLAYSHEVIIGMNELHATLRPDLVQVLPDYSINDAIVPFDSLYLIRHPYKENLAHRLFVEFIKYIFKLHKERNDNIMESVKQYLKI